MVEFKFQEMFPLGEDTTTYRHLTQDYVTVTSMAGQSVTVIQPEALTVLAEAAFRDVSHRYRTSHLASLKRILDDPEASTNDRFVALEMLKNAVIAAEGEFPMCQDTGTAIILGKKGQQVWTGAADEEALSRGVFNAYTGKIGRRRVGKECRSRWSPYH